MAWSPSLPAPIREVLARLEARAGHLHGPLQDRLAPYLDALSAFKEIRNPRVLQALAPAGVRGMLLRRGEQGGPVGVSAHHDARFEWDYPTDAPALAALYRRAKAHQWDGEDLPWHTSVDPLSPEVALAPYDFFDWELGERLGIRLSAQEKRQLLFSVITWSLSQFLHGEQGALYAAAQVTEAMPGLDGKLFGSTQVVDEGRHVEVFHRYLDTKMGRVYRVNDNLYTLLDALLSDRRWDMKFLGMQILVEGLALGGFAMMYQATAEPLLKELLRRVIQDEARHVHYGVVSLRRLYTQELTETERAEREDWAFEVALLMRNRFLGPEVWEEWFAGTRVRRRAWDQFITGSRGMQRFRHLIFSRTVPNLREIGLLRPRIRPAYERAGLGSYFFGASTDTLGEDGVVAGLDEAA